MLPPVFIQYNATLGDALNAGVPGQDHTSYGDLVAKQIAGVVRAYGTAEDPGA